MVVLLVCVSVLYTLVVPALSGMAVSSQNRHQLSKIQKNKISQQKSTK